MSLITQSIWNGKLFNGTWFDTENHYSVEEVATGETLGKIGYADKYNVIEAGKQAQKAQKD